jgi:hypothetical protein
MTKHYNPVKSAISTSQVSGELYRASNIARKLSLSAKNSQAIVHRAGSKVTGLKVISEYFADLSLTTIKLADSVSRISLNISHMAVKLWRKNLLVKHLLTSQNKENNQQVNLIIEQTTLEEQETNEFFNREVRHLENKLEDIRQYMQASRVVAVSFRLEATQSEECQGILDDMANNIDSFSEQIKQHIVDAKSHIDQLL